MKNLALWCTAVSALACVQAHAQGAPAGDSVTLYGMVDAGVSWVSNEGGHSNLKFDDGIFTPNLLGIRGSEDLGGGLHAIFDLVDQFSMGTGAIISGQGLFGRNAYVGLSSDRYGKLTLGNQYDFMTDSLFFGHDDAAMEVGGLYNFRAGPFSRIGIPGNPPFASQFNWDRMAGATVQNSIKYQSPSIAGFSFGGLYGFGGIPGALGSGDSVSAGVNYAQGPLGLGAAYTEVKYVESGEPDVGIRNWGVGAHYDFGKVTATLLVTTVRNTQNGGAIAEAETGASWLLAPDWAIGGSYMYMKGNGYLDNNHGHQINAIVDHFLSKRTVVYAEAVWQRTNAGAQALISGVLDPDGTSGGPNQVIARVGVQTRF
ncbi:porin [Paraburkholderia oxyphila]|uniref:porin n=1 Tax=Paraburkholderia oxyphila TaxID=614212 RepID=UPI0005BDA40C|nr:porin [Paraburkholderia oxyphila]